MSNANCILDANFSDFPRILAAYYSFPNVAQRLNFSSRLVFPIDYIGLLKVEVREGAQRERERERERENREREKERKCVLDLCLQRVCKLQDRTIEIETDKAVR